MCRFLTRSSTIDLYLSHRHTYVPLSVLPSNLSTSPKPLLVSVALHSQFHASADSVIRNWICWNRFCCISHTWAAPQSADVFPSDVANWISLTEPFCKCCTYPGRVMHRELEIVPKRRFTDFSLIYTYCLILVIIFFALITIALTSEKKTEGGNLTRFADFRWNFVSKLCQLQWA